MFCGAGSFPRVDEDTLSPPPSPPRVSSRRQGRSSNPYSTRGLDKFSTVLVELESRREKIMAKAGDLQGVPVVRFVYSSSHDWVPIVVRPREQRSEPEKPKKGVAAESRNKPDAAAEEHQTPPRMDAKGAAPAEPAPNRVVKESFPRKVEGREGVGFFRWDPSYYWPAVVVLILLCLAFGRAFAICCTSICWYSLPRAKVDESRNVKKAVKKEYRRRANEKQLGAGGGGDVVKMNGDLLGFASHGHHRGTAERSMMKG